MSEPQPFRLFRFGRIRCAALECWRFVATHRRRSVHLAVSFSVTAFFLCYIGKNISPQEILGLLKDIDRTYLSLYVLFSFLGAFFRAKRYELLFMRVATASVALRFWDIFLITLIRDALVDLFPARLGELGPLYFYKKKGVPFSSGIASFGYCVIFDVIVLISLSLLFLIASVCLSGFLPQIFSVSATLLTYGLLSLLIALLSVLLFGLPRVMGRVAQIVLQIEQIKLFHLGSRLRPLWEKLEAASTEMQRDFLLFREQGIFLPLLAYTFCLRVLKYTSLYLLLLAVLAHWGLGYREIPPGISFIAFVIAEASASLPMSGIMGFGAYESAWTLVFSISSSAIPSPLQVSFVLHLLSQVRAYSLASLAYLVLFFGMSRGEDT